MLKNKLLASAAIAVGLVLGGTAVGVALSDTSSPAPTVKVAPATAPPATIAPDLAPAEAPPAVDAPVADVEQPAEQPQSIVEDPQPVDDEPSQIAPLPPSPIPTTMRPCLYDPNGNLESGSQPSVNCG